MVRKDKIIHNEYMKNYMKKRRLESQIPPEIDFVFVYNKMQKIKRENDLYDFMYWLNDITRLNKQFLKKYPPWAEYRLNLIK